MQYVILSAILVLTDWLWLRAFNSVPIGFTKALLDNSNHGFAGAISWLMVRCWQSSQILGRTVLMETSLTFAIASLIDLDHFIEARSIYLEVILY